MNSFQAYLIMGFDHITDLNGYDHILFIVALCSIYQITEWKRILVLVTAFTIGHSITLAVATLQLFTYRTDVVEFLIPITILLTAIFNLFYKVPKGYSLSNPTKPQYSRYFLAIGFGLIHGLGFSNYLRSLLGKEESIWQPLLAFNIGLELGQLIIVAIFVIIASLFERILNTNRRDWNLVLSGAVAGMALILIQKTWIF
ncbi:HupE/UreJ family protein [Cytophagaceae bacterium DM2B3-1]|uniref:HupE/UreJ family protein n=1 Tax=Xanthocytophaga flava TaxID=3048013 RepID=A0AAE3UAB1_9BACT|nr:HupE/UreJ family protein [Xanthocytophaga flavus]MDJ1484532.1 HupE/UreJ family protein [Xanthocytophaga flavus]MDJ1498380.1 HupE/UreJ family protein [Xanthocytophaga flavus]